MEALLCDAMEKVDRTRATKGVYHLTKQFGFDAVNPGLESHPLGWTVLRVERSSRVGPVKHAAHANFPFGPRSSGGRSTTSRRSSGQTAASGCGTSRG